MMMILQCLRKFPLQVRQETEFGETQWTVPEKESIESLGDSVLVSVKSLYEGRDDAENCSFSECCITRNQCTPQVKLEGRLFLERYQNQCRTSLSMRLSSPDWKSAFRPFCTLIISSSCDDPWPSSSPLPEPASSEFGSWSTWAMYICCRGANETKEVKIIHWKSWNI